MTNYTKSTIIRIHVLIIIILGIISSLVNLSIIEKAVAATCIDTALCNKPHKSFSFGRVHTGDCTLQWATFYLFPGGQGQLKAFVSSTSSSDSWGFQNILFIGLQQSFYIGDLWSPTLPVLDPNVSSDNPNWVTRFTYHGDYQKIEKIHLNYHC